MSFILNYLDEALDTVTGRYDEHAEDNGSEGGSTVGGAVGDGGEGERRPPCTCQPVQTKANTERKGNVVRV